MHPHLLYRLAAPWNDELGHSAAQARATRPGRSAAGRSQGFWRYGGWYRRGVIGGQDRRMQR
jgi:hypothetical protein